MAPITAQRLTGKTTKVQSAAVTPQQKLVPSPVDTALLKDISKSLTNIIQLLSQQNLQSKKEYTQALKTEERDRRQGIELGLEKPFAVVKNAAQAVIAPVKSILDQIIQFFLTLFLGRALILLLDWFADEKNRSKVRSIMRFLSDWWPSLVAGYILFGTGFGRVVRKVAGVAISATARLVVIAGRLAKAIATGKGLKGAAAAFSGGGKLGGLKGFALRGGLAAAATIGTGLFVNKFVGGEEDQQLPQLDVPDVPAVPALGAYGGGLADLKDLLYGATSNVNSNIFSPFTTMFATGGLADVMRGFGGIVSGPKGIDKVPAMLTDGEFVMSRGAVQKFGVNTLEAMNSAGGGTNQPKIIRGIPHAYGGGLIGEKHQHETKEPKSNLYSGGLMNDRKEDLAKKNIDERIKRIEYQIKIQNALASGNGIKTAVGTGYGTTYNGRQSILVKDATQKLGAGTGYDAITTPEINVGGMRYFAQKSGKDIIYSSNYAKGLKVQVDKYGARNKSYTGLGGGLVGGSGLNNVDSKNLPKTKIMMGDDGKSFVGHLTFKNGTPSYQRNQQRNKGMLESMADFFNPGGAKGRQETLNARSMRLAAITDLESYRKRGMKEPQIKKMLNERVGANGYSRAVNDYNAKQSRINKEKSQRNLDKLTWGNVGPDMMPKRFAEENRVRREEYDKKGGLLGQLGRMGQRMFGGSQANKKLDLQQKATEARAKQAGAASIGKYYSSSDGKYYANYAAADAARKSRQANIAKSKPKSKTITPPPKPAPKVVTKSTSSSGGGAGRRGSGSNPSVPQIPSSSGSSRKNANILGLK